MKFILFISLLVSQIAFAAPAAKSNDVEMDDIQAELMQELDNVSLTVEDEEFLDQEIEGMPEVEKKLQIISDKNQKTNKEVKEAKKDAPAPVKK